MKNYLSFGGGVNSVALHLYLLDQEWEFESVFVNHGTDWPETYEYLNMFQGWLEKNGMKPIVVLKPGVKRGDKIYNNLYECCIERVIKPHYAKKNRWCSIAFKSEPLMKYQQTPCFVLTGFDVGESHRASISIANETENRYPLIEDEITREDCKKIIREHGLPIPIKSGYFICPFQNYTEWRKLRIEHPDLFCKAEKLETAYIEKRKREGKKPLHLSAYRMRLRSVINEDQLRLFKQDKYPPCNCMS